MKRKIAAVVYILFFLAGLSLLLYPTFSNYWNDAHATQSVVSYKQVTDDMTEAQNAQILSEADAYNIRLASKGQISSLSDKELDTYNGVLDLNSYGIMGYIEIPSIQVELPIYHGTSEPVLQTAVGHLDWTSLPVGGDSTHCVLSGHRGLPSAKLFTDLDELTKGDTFILTVLNRVCTYEVYDIETVLPEETESLAIQEGEDLCTLVTCTPYGINTHRLLVHARRVENAKKTVNISSTATQIEPIMVMPFIALPLLLIAFVLLRIIDKKFDYS